MATGQASYTLHTSTPASGEALDTGAALGSQGWVTMPHWQPHSRNCTARLRPSAPTQTPTLQDLAGNCSYPCSCHTPSEITYQITVQRLRHWTWLRREQESNKWDASRVQCHLIWVAPKDQMGHNRRHRHQNRHHQTPSHHHSPKTHWRHAQGIGIQGPKH
jgi:glycine/D-amino acid oxidase-like deaminating enzyme